jgi:hypothetical protein
MAIHFIALRLISSRSAVPGTAGRKDSFDDDCDQDRHR